ncbi:MAG: DUF3108 domain-containing protein [Puniceicoccaceae bacterium]
MKVVVTMLISIIGAVMPLVAAPAGSDAMVVRSSFPFHRVGEELQYTLKWGPFEVGSGVLRILPIREVDGEACFHLSLEVRTSGFADSIYKVRSRFDSFVSVQYLRPVRYQLNQREGKTRRKATVTFDWQSMTASYQREGEETKEPVEIEAGTWDPLSVVFFFRQIVSAEPGVVTLPATDGKKSLLIDVGQEGLVSFEGAMGKREAIKVEPNTKELRGVFQKSKDSNILMWFSADEQRVPLRIQSKVVVGSFYAELQSVQRVDRATSEIPQDGERQDANP